MKKILFLSFPYPYAKFGPSTNCCVRIMKRLVESGKYEVHCFSYCDTYGKKNFDEIPGVKLHIIPIKDPRRKESSRFMTHLKLFLKIPLYPFRFLISDFRHYRVCKKIIKKEQFDLVVSQCYSEQSMMTGVLLKKYGYIQKLMVIFWDNIYGMVPQRVIPKRFALQRQRVVESWIAKYADRLVSLYPIKQFHDKYGDVTSAKDKRVYLGIPSLIKPMQRPDSAFKDKIVDGKINVLYSGTIYNTEHLEYLIELLNTTSFAEKINFIVFCRGVGEEKADVLKKTFKGSLQIGGWIPLNDLMALYPLVDYFVSFPGNPNAIRSKVYEYMSYGKPILILYNNDSDVNKAVFSRYPASKMIDVRVPKNENTDGVNGFLAENHTLIPFEITEELFRLDSPRAYFDEIERMLG